jgi:predicted DNA-binding transcriptional regulator AlpA
MTALPHQPRELEDLVTGAEIARRLGFTRARAHQLAGRPDFPNPIGRVGNYVVWRWSDIKAWLPSVERPPVVEIYGWTDAPHISERKVWYQVVVGETRYEPSTDHASVLVEAERLRAELDTTLVDRSDRGNGYLASTIARAPSARG